MAKLYPPYIEGTIPAFFEDDDGTVILTVPLSMNKAVGVKEIKGFELKIKTTQTGLLLDTFTSSNFDLTDKMTVWFDLRSISKPLVIGQYYKIQIAYIGNDDTVGYYSTVGVTKYTTKPTVSIEGLEPRKINMHKYGYLGLYSQKNKDITERVYSSRFDLFDLNKKLIATTGDILHNRSNDINNYESQDEWFYPKDLDKGSSYYIKYTVNTLNGLAISSPAYKIIQNETIDPEINVELIADLNFDNGYVELSLKGNINPEIQHENIETGSFVIMRSSEDENFSNWSEIFRFNLNAAFPSKTLWRDHTIEQGRTYRYSLQQYNNYDLYSNRILSNDIYADFEDAFLFDGKRQLKIKYNPKVSSFKNTIYETKTDTVGGKHPFIFRNGVVNYKEFPISGMISYFMDEDELFLSKTDYNLKEKTINLVGNNIASERQFKLEVLDWLTNGEVKLFRSPAEGNYLIRLLNVSLTPQDPLGRMLHTFNGTAYEVAEYNFNNLLKFKIAEVKDPSVENLQWQTIRFFDNLSPNGISHVPYGNPYATESSEEIIEAYMNNKKIILDATKNILRLKNGVSFIAKTVVFTDLMPGDKVLIIQENLKSHKQEAQIFTIGATGAYQVESPVGITGVYLIEEKMPYGNLTFSHSSPIEDTFSLYANINIEDIPVRQFIGVEPSQNIIEIIEDIKTKILHFYQLNFIKRPIENIYVNTNNENIMEKYYSHPGCAEEDQIIEDDLNPYCLYKIMDGDSYFLECYLDGCTKEIFQSDSYGTKIRIDDNPAVDINETEEFILNNFNNIKTISFDKGVMLTAAYQTRTYTYNLEIDPEVYLSDEELLKEVQKNRQNWIDAMQILADKLQELEEVNGKLENFNEQELINNVHSRYDNFLLRLEKALKLYKEDNDIK